MSPSKPVSVLDFSDYRAFLAEYFRWHKANERGFSHRAFSSRLGFTSPNFLKLVMDGKRNMGTESLPKITAGLRLNKQETEYFSYLVFFANARNTIDKNYYYGLITALRSRKNIASVVPAQFEYFSEWYHPVVRELVAGLQEPLDFNDLSSKLGLSPLKIRKSLRTLLRLKLVIVDENNTYVFSSPLLNTANELDSYAIRRYHSEVLNVAQGKLSTVPPAEREISQLTMKLSKEGFEKIKQRLQMFRQELLQMASEDRGVDSVYHANFQFYPLTRAPDHEA